MGETLTVDGPKLVPVLSGIHLPISEGWKAVLPYQRKDVRRSADMSCTGNRSRVARIVAERFTHYATAVKIEPCHTLNGRIFIFKEKNRRKIHLSKEAKSRVNSMS